MTEAAIREPTLNEYMASMKSLSGLLMTGGVVVPATAYFTLFSPPMLESSSLFTAGISLATVLAVYYYRFRPADVVGGYGFPRVVKLALRSLTVAVVCFFAYLVLLRFTTIVDPRGQERYQIGFYKLSWSLSDAGKLKPQVWTVEDWMMSGAYFRDGGPEVLWKPAAIYSAGTLLMLLFMISFVLWTVGWALLAKHYAYTSREPLVVDSPPQPSSPVPG